MAQLGPGQASEFPRRLDDVPALPALEVQVEGLYPQDGADHWSQLLQIAADLGVVMDSRPFIVVLHEACLARDLVLSYDSEAGYRLLPTTDARVVQEDARRGESRGRYLCEVCFDTLTDDILLAYESPFGCEMAICQACRLRR